MTNPIESYHRKSRKVTKTKGAFSSEDTIVKQIYLATINAITKRERSKVWLANCPKATNQLFWRPRIKE